MAHRLFHPWYFLCVVNCACLGKFTKNGLIINDVEGGDVFLMADYMPLHYLAGFVDAEGYRPGSFRCPSVPSAGMGTAGVLGSLESSFCGGMRDAPGGVLLFLDGPSGEVRRAVVTGRPDVVRDFGDGWSNKNGIMCVHAPKGNG